MPRKRESNHHLPKGVTVHHGAYWFRATGKKPVRVCGLGEEHKLWAWAHSDGVSHDGPIETINDCFDRYLIEVLPTLAPRTQSDYRKAIVVLRERFGHMHPDEVLPRDIGRYYGYGRGSVHRARQIAVLSAMYSIAVGRWFVADRNPCAKVQKPKVNRRTRYVTDSEFQAVRELAPPRVQVAMDLALLTGQRQGDLLSLKWTQVTPEGILFQQGKTGKKLLVATSPALEEVLARARAMRPDIPKEYVIRTRHGRQYSGAGFQTLWKLIRNKAIKTGRLTESFTFHDLRAKSASDSGSLQAAYERLGHSSPSMTRQVYDRGVRVVTPLR